MPRNRNRQSDQLLRSRSRNAAENRETQEEKRARQIRSWAILVALVVGAALGFRAFNRYPAALFMGDAGSTLVGYLLASASTEILGYRWHSAPAALATFALPLLDLTAAVARRLWHRQSPFAPDRSHIHHALVDRGLPHPLASALLTATAVGCGVIGVFLGGTF